jgi:hypothetical protein
LYSNFRAFARALALLVLVDCIAATSIISNELVLKFSIDAELDEAELSDCNSSRFDSEKSLPVVCSLTYDTPLAVEAGLEEPGCV